MSLKWKIGIRLALIEFCAVFFWHFLVNGNAGVGYWSGLIAFVMLLLIWSCIPNKLFDIAFNGE